MHLKYDLFARGYISASLHNPLPLLILHQSKKQITFCEAFLQTVNEQSLIEWRIEEINEVTQIIIQDCRGNQHV
jgi:hypothetical protein